MNAKFHGIDVEVRKIVGDEAVIYPIPTQGLGLYHNAIKVPAAELEFDASEDDMEAIHNYIVAAEAGDRASLAYGDADLGTRFTISGGEVLELGPQSGTEDLPF